MNQLAGGLLAGRLATIPMTGAMRYIHSRLPENEQYPLPPREITEKIAEETGVEEHLSESQMKTATLLAHFTYGSISGLVYTGVAPYLPGPPVVRGMTFGLGVWAGSYMGLLPALGILKPATEHPPRRNGMMIVSHLIYGAALGLLVHKLVDEQ